MQEFYLTDNPFYLSFKFICVKGLGNKVAGSSPYNVGIGEGTVITGYDHDFDAWIF